VGDDEGIGCETMRCYADDGSIQCKDVGPKGQAVARKVLANFLSREEEQPLEREFKFHFNLLFNTVDYASLKTLLRPDRWYHAGVCENIVIRPRAC
jgi:hypothetical protein